MVKGDVMSAMSDDDEMFYQQFLKRAVDPADSVTLEFIDLMVPYLMEQYAVTSAKGGEHSRNTELSEATKRKFEAKPDQSMVSHQLNGIFPTLRLLNLLEAERLLVEPFSRVERRVYILSYLMHDVDKIIHSHGIETGDRAAIEHAKDVIADQLRLCNVEAFFPDFAAYLEDVAYLVVNTQRKWGTHLNTYGWRFQLKERRLFELRRLCTYSDQIAYLVPSPAAILGEEGSTLNTILDQLSDHQLTFTYHQLREVRGLFTNVINNGLVSLFKDGREGIWPYLFFADGVVYIKRKSLQFTISTEQIVEKVRDELRQVCAGTIKSQAPGFKFSIQGIAKHPGYYFEFLTLEDYLELLLTFTINRTTNDITVIPFEKLRQMQANGDIPPDLPLDLKTDVRVGIISRFLSVVFTTVLGMLDRKQEAIRQQLEQAVVDHLGLTPYWEQSKTIPNRGGVEYRWFWLGACYLRDHPGITAQQGEGKLEDVFTSTRRLILRLADEELRKGMPQKYLGHLTSYLESIIELPLAIRSGGALPNFQEEIERYLGAKSNRGRKLICTMCNSAYPTEEQSDNAVLFQPWVYKNKLSLYAGKNAGGVCAICALELMLRQILQKGQMRLTGSKFEAMKTKFLYVYPNFFFTAETGAMVQGILDQLQNINFFTERKHLQGKRFTVRDLWGLSAFAAPQIEQKGVLVAPSDDEDEDDEPDEEVAAESEKPTARTDSGYIKYEKTEFPGLCFFGMRAAKDDDDTSSWAMPALLALTLPLVTDTKVVISEMSLPLFSSGHDFRETVIFDAPHPFLERLLKEKRLRINELLPKLRLLEHLYEVNLDTYSKQGKPEWKHLNSIARDIDTDPLYLFSYLRKQQRSAKRDALSAYDALRYMGIYKEMLDLEDKLGTIQECVDRFTIFYRGGFQSHSILKPVDLVAKAIINSPLNIDREDLLWQVQGQIQSWLDRVRSHQAEGRAMFWGKEITAQEMPAVREFVRYFYDEIFMIYCQGERGILRNRINVFKDGCEAYYKYWRSQQTGNQVAEEEGEEGVVSDPVG
jgi:CRISPR-associated protein Csc3